MMIQNNYRFSISLFLAGVLSWFLLILPGVSEAATLRLSPDTGVYGTGQTISTKILINTEGKPVNAAEGQLSFNPRELQVVSVSRSASIFSLWTQEPSFSNTAGIVTFGGGSPQGYTGSQGTVVVVTFKALGAGTPKVTFTSGSVLAADGLGTNVLTSMKGSSFTIGAESSVPVAEYIAPQNTPSAPVVTSSTHGDETKWYEKKTALLSWQLPSDVIAVRTLLDQNRSSIPTVVYESRVSEKEITDLPEGISYFHIQFKNAEGWGRVTHYRLAVDTEAPSAFSITLGEGTDAPQIAKKTLIFEVEDTSPIEKYRIQINGGSPIEFVDGEKKGKYTLDALPPGHHTVQVEAFDSAGLSTISSIAFDIEAFEAPIITDYPERLPTNVIPAIKGTTRPGMSVEVLLRDRDGHEIVGKVESTTEGGFVFVPDAELPVGVYELSATAHDPAGGQSAPSEPVTIIVEESVLVRTGSMVLNVLSVVVPIIALLLVLAFGTWYLWHRLSVWKRYVLKETKEAEYRLAVEFDAITSHLEDNVNKLKKTKKGKLTEGEQTLIDAMKQDIDRARDRIAKEISDIDDIVT